MGANPSPSPAIPPPVTSHDLQFRPDVLSNINEFQSIPDRANFGMTSRENCERIKPEMSIFREVNNKCGREALNRIYDRDESVYEV